MHYQGVAIIRYTSRDMPSERVTLSCLDRGIRQVGDKTLVREIRLFTCRSSYLRKSWQHLQVFVYISSYPSRRRLDIVEYCSLKW